MSKKHLSTTNNQQQSSSVQIIDDLDHLDEYSSIFQHSPPSNQQKHFKSTNQLNTLSSTSNLNVHNVNNEIASSSTKLVTKQPFIFTIDYPLLSQDGNTSSSVLKLRLNQRMHLNRLICRATNFEVQRDSELEDQQLLNILCKLFFLEHKLCLNIDDSFLINLRK